MLYHVYNKSIAGFAVFRNNEDFSRMLQSMRHYLYLPKTSFGHYAQSSYVREVGFDVTLRERIQRQGLKPALNIAAYCIMNTHFHWLIEEIVPGAVVRYVRLILDSYTRYFNLKYLRQGPLWQGRTRQYSVLSGDVLEKTIYIHLNPVTAYMADDPGNWPYSSWKEYAQDGALAAEFCVLPEEVRREGKDKYRCLAYSSIEHYRQKAKINLRS